MTDSSNKRRVVITGYGMVTPLGKNTEETFAKASKGESGIDYIKSFDTTGLPCRIGGEIDDIGIELRLAAPGTDDFGIKRHHVAQT